MNITIRLAAPADAPEMAEIHMRSWEAAYRDIIPIEYIREKNATRPALWKRILIDDNTTEYAIQSGGKIIGIMGIAVSRDEDADNAICELKSIYLHPDHFRQGIGTQAMAFAFEKARKLGKSVMTLWVFAENDNSIKFYEKCGFAPDGKTKTLDCGKKMDCVRMRKNL